MKKIIIALFLLLSFTSMISALQLNQTTIDVAVIPEFTQATKVPVVITGADPGEYVIYTLTAVKVLPTDKFALHSGQNNLVFDVYPTDKIYANGPSTYSFAVELRNVDTDSVYDATMAVRVVSIYDALEISSDVNSPDSEQISFYIRNKEGIDLKNVHVKFSSVFFDTEQTLDLKANSVTNVSINVPADKLKKIEAGSYLVKAAFQTNRGEKTLEGRIYLQEKTDIQTQSNVSGFLIITDKVSKLNNGNVNQDVVINIKRNIVSRLFTSFSVEPDSVERDGLRITYTWSKKLGPAENIVVSARTNYLIPILIIIAIILIVIGIRRLTQTKLIVEKSAVPVKTSSGQFALKIKLKVKSIGRVSNVSLIDRIPGIVQIYENAPSIIKPTKIDSNNKRIQWDIGDMDSGEERSFSYIVYSTVGVVGKFALPKALTVFEKDGQIHEVESNVVYFMAEQRASDF